MNRRPGSIIPARAGSTLANGCETRVTERQRSHRISTKSDIAGTKAAIDQRPHSWTTPYDPDANRSDLASLRTDGRPVGKATGRFFTFRTIRDRERLGPPSRPKVR